MDTKWKKFSRSMGVRIILNLLLIAAILIETLSVEKITTLQYDMGNSKLLENDGFYGNSELCEEFQAALEDVLAYVLEIKCASDNKESSEKLANSKKVLDEKWKNYKYSIAFTGEDGKEKNISNCIEEITELEQFPVSVTYEGDQWGSAYLKDWGNRYEGEKVNYDWLMVNDLILDICKNNKSYATFVANQMAGHTEIYEEVIKDVVKGVLGKKDIYKKIYKDDVTNMELGTAATNHGLTKEEEDKLAYAVAASILSIRNFNGNIQIPMAAIFGTPQSYSITFAIDQTYFNNAVQGYKIDYEQNLRNVQSIIKQRDNVAYVMFYDFIAFLILMLALFYVCGRRKDSEEVEYLVIDKIGSEFVIGIECLLFLWLNYFVHDFTYLVNLDIHGRIIYAFMPVVTVWLMAQFAFSLMRRIKGKQLLATSFTIKVVNRIRKVLGCIMSAGKLTTVSVVLAVILPVFYAIVILAGTLILVYNYLSIYAAFWLLAIFIFLFMSWCAMIMIVYHKTVQFKKIYDGVEAVKSGNIQYQITTGGTGMMEKLAQNINSLSDGLEDAVNEMLKSEHLKTELISNVSHDIKTPLTSIITYVDLLKKEQVQPEKAKEYIEIIDQKSQRLKGLTEDLFEAAKASSGAMAMELTTLDVGSLIHQGIGEFEQKFNKINLDARYNVPDETYYVIADGRLLWRIFENILSNVSKYALPDSRVYIDVTELPETIRLTVKNISACELNISAEELMERFTRGDQSRNSEGSGLGLNIAQSLAELQHGKFYVEIDGDLFKSILEMPKSTLRNNVMNCEKTEIKNELS